MKYIIRGLKKLSSGKSIDALVLICITVLFLILALSCRPEPTTQIKPDTVTTIDNQWFIGKEIKKNTKN